ncbi:hypothetical protein INR49_026016, partial [Caranx melampygus]
MLPRIYQELNGAANQRSYRYQDSPRHLPRIDQSSPGFPCYQENLRKDRPANEYSRRGRSQEQMTLKQGIPAPDAPMEGPEKLPAAMQKGPTLHFGSLAEPHHFNLPPNTAGQAKLRERPETQAISQAPPPCQKPC